MRYENKDKAKSLIKEIEMRTERVELLKKGEGTRVRIETGDCDVPGLSLAMNHAEILPETEAILNRVIEWEESLIQKLKTDLAAL